MAGEALRREDAILARLRAHRALVARAEATIADALAAMDKPAVAFSGGKDSLLTLALVRRQRPGVAVIWSDDELEYDETVAFVPTVCAAWGLPLTVTAGVARHAGWFRPWRDKPFWRAPLPGMLAIRERVETWQARQGYGVFTGLRAVEARRRRLNTRMRGLLYRRNDGGMACQPLAWWPTANVWAAIAEMEIPYNPAYDVLARIGVGRERQRVGPLPLTPGWVLRDGWPEISRRLVARYGERW